MFKNEYAWPNLVQDGFVPEEQPRERSRDFYGGGPSRSNNFDREQVVTPTYYDDKPIGQYMRQKPSEVEAVPKPIEEKKEAEPD